MTAVDVSDPATGSVENETPIGADLEGRTVGRSQLRTVAEESAEAGAAVAMDAFRTGVDVERKGGKTDVVTDADRAAQSAVVARIREVFPDDPVCGEEDVTRAEIPETFQVSPIVWWDLTRREEYVGAMEGLLRRFGDIRRVGCAQAALSMVAAGTLEGVLTNRVTEPWDTIAGTAMVGWAGGEATDAAGEPWSHRSRGLAASNGRRHDLLLEAIRETDAAAER